MKGGTCALQRKAKSVVQSVISSLTSGRRSVTANDNESQNLGITANRLNRCWATLRLPTLDTYFFASYPEGYGSRFHAGSASQTHPACRRAGPGHEGNRARGRRAFRGPR